MQTATNNIIGYPAGGTADLSNSNRFSGGNHVDNAAVRWWFITKFLTNMNIGLIGARIDVFA
jgi:hypothetical protein